MTGIDISKYQPAIPAGAWDFIFARATHDASGVDPLFDEHFPNALARSPRRGAYHFWNPTESGGVPQAQHFAQVCLANGFRPGIDVWALDVEESASGAHDANAIWVRAFMRMARALLGNLCFLYIGWPFYEANFGSDLTLLHEQAWWLPSYGPNDGQPHAPTCPFLPVIHQFTSRGGANGGGLDVNRILDTAGWASLFTSAPAPKPPAPPVPPTQHAPIDLGDNVKLTTISGIHLDTNGDGEVAVAGVSEANMGPVLVIGGSNPLDPKVKRYDKTPITRVVPGSNPALIVISGGEPSGTYTVRASHA